MGTNYYIHPNTCEKCGRSDDAIHLGKSSFGWSFGIQANGFTEYKNWEQMKEWLKGKQIKDEYGEDVSLDDFIKLVESKKDIEDPETDWGSSAPVTIDGYKFFDHDFS